MEKVRGWVIVNWNVGHLPPKKVKKAMNKYRDEFIDEGMIPEGYRILLLPNRNGNCSVELLEFNTQEENDQSTET